LGQTFRLPLRIVFYKEDGDWIAHCLEFDLMGDGETKETALDQLGEAILLQIQASAENDNPANLITPADGKFFRMFAAGRDVARAALEFRVPHIENVEIEDWEYREYIGGEACAV
jgi:predicted RNase H-like HicB family nuclease